MDPLLHVMSVNPVEVALPVAIGHSVEWPRVIDVPLLCAKREQQFFACMEERVILQAKF